MQRQWMALSDWRCLKLNEVALHRRSDPQNEQEGKATNHGHGPMSRLQKNCNRERAAEREVIGPGLNFYVAHWELESQFNAESVQYRRLLLARVMTGDFAAAWMPSVFVPLVGILGPAVAMALLFNVIEARD